MLCVSHTAYSSDIVCPHGGPFENENSAVATRSVDRGRGFALVHTTWLSAKKESDPRPYIIPCKRPSSTHLGFSGSCIFPYRFIRL